MEVNMQKVHFSGYSDLSCFPTVGKVAGVQNETNYYNLSKVPLIYDRNYELRLERMAVITGDWYYYNKLLNVRRERMEVEAAHKEILEKYPYDGKSTFAELLIAEINKVNSNK